MRMIRGPQRAKASKHEEVRGLGDLVTEGRQRTPEGQRVIWFLTEVTK